MTNNLFENQEETLVSVIKTNIMAFAQSCARITEMMILVMLFGKNPLFQIMGAILLFIGFPIVIIGTLITIAEYIYVLLLTDGVQERLIKTYLRQTYYLSKFVAVFFSLGGDREQVVKIYLYANQYRTR